MRNLTALLIAILLTFSVASAATHHKKTVQSSSTKVHRNVKPVSKTKAGVATQHGRAKVGRAARGRSKAVRAAVPKRPPAQGNPSASRYIEIQQALAAKGYLKTAPSGVWDQDSIDALKRFQADQKLSTTGKLSSLSLIALGLGPKPADTPEPAAH